MPGTKEGAKKALATMKRRYGVTPDGKSKLHVEAGAIGGSISQGGGFSNMDKKKHREASAKGGQGKRRNRESYEAALRS